MDDNAVRERPAVLPVQAAPCGKRRAGVIVSVVVLVGALIATGVAFGPDAWRAVIGPAPTDISTLGLDVFSETVIVRADGTRIPIVLPGYQAGTSTEGPYLGPGARVPSGFVLAARGADGQAMWFLPDGGKPQLVGAFSGNWAVSPDGTVLVVTGTKYNGGIEATSVTAYRLPNLTILRGPYLSRLGDNGGAPRVVGIGGDMVVTQGLDAIGPSIGVWDLRTGAWRERRGVHALDLTRDGRVLLNVDQPDATSCLNLVTIDNALAAGPVGACVAHIEFDDASLSPDGVWALLPAVFWEGSHNDDLADVQSDALVRTQDLAAGRWSPIRFRPFPDHKQSAQLPYLWDADRTFIVQKYKPATVPLDAGREPAGFYRCGVERAACVPLAMPDGLDSPKPLARHGS